MVFDTAVLDEIFAGLSTFVSQVDIVNNIGVWGGAISISGQSSGTKFVCAKCRFQENYSVTVGAGCVHMVDRVQATFIETSFDHCVAGEIISSCSSCEYGC